MPAFDFQILYQRSESKLTLSLNDWRHHSDPGSATHGMITLDLQRRLCPTGFFITDLVSLQRNTIKLPFSENGASFRLRTHGAGLCETPAAQPITWFDTNVSCCAQPHSLRALAEPRSCPFCSQFVLGAGRSSLTCCVSRSRPLRSEFRTVENDQGHSNASDTVRVDHFSFHLFLAQ